MMTTNPQKQPFKGELVLTQAHSAHVMLVATTRGPSKTLDCTQCGACCFGLAVHLTPRETRLFQANKELKRLIKPQDHGFCMRRTVNESRCFALKGKPGCCTCKVYDDRPRVCREFEPGSEACLRARARFHIC